MIHHAYLGNFGSVQPWVATFFVRIPAMQPSYAQCWLLWNRLGVLKFRRIKQSKKNCSKIWGSKHGKTLCLVLLSFLSRGAIWHTPRWPSSGKTYWRRNRQVNQKEKWPWVQDLTYTWRLWFLIVLQITVLNIYIYIYIIYNRVIYRVYWTCRLHQSIYLDVISCYSMLFYAMLPSTLRTGFPAPFFRVAACVASSGTSATCPPKAGMEFLASSSCRQGLQQVSIQRKSKMGW